MVTTWSNVVQCWIPCSQQLIDELAGSADGFFDGSACEEARFQASQRYNVPPESVLATVTLRRFLTDVQRYEDSPKEDGMLMRVRVESASE